MKLTKVEFVLEDHPGGCVTVTCRRENRAMHGADLPDVWTTTLNTQSGYFTLDPDAVDGVVEELTGLSRFMASVQKTLRDTAMVVVVGEGPA